MSENMKNGLLWAAAALGVLSLLQGLFRGMTGLFMGGSPKDGGHHFGQGGRGFEPQHEMMSGQFPGGEGALLVTIVPLIIIAILVFVIWKLWKKKKQPIMTEQVNEDTNNLDKEEVVANDVLEDNEQRNSNEIDNDEGIAENDKGVK